MSTLHGILAAAIEGNASMKILTVKELSPLIRIAPPTLYQWAELGKIPCLKIHGCLRFDLDEVMAWLDGFKNDKISHAETAAKPGKGDRDNGRL